MNAPKFEGWMHYSIHPSGVVVYSKETKYNSELTIKHLGLWFEYHWYNYCHFVDDPSYLEENIIWFLTNIKMQRDWNKRIGII